MAAKKYRKLAEAPDTFEGAEGIEPGKQFEADYTADQERALVAAGWVEPVEKKEGGK